MKRETTPERITDEILELCNIIVPKTLPEYIPVRVMPWSKSMDCFSNVPRTVNELGGAQVNGWAIWQWANMLLDAEAHSIWKSPDGKLFDITPHDYGETEILFLYDRNLVYSGQLIGNRRLPLTNSPLVSELITLYEKRDSILCSYRPGTAVPFVEWQRHMQPIENRIRTILNIIHQKAGPNDPCPCQSGLKYKKCCGR